MKKILIFGVILLTTMSCHKPRPIALPFALRAQVKLQSFMKSGGVQIKQYGGFNNIQYVDSVFHSGGSGGVVSVKVYDIGDGWRVLTFPQDNRVSVAMYVIWHEGEKVDVQSAACGSVSMNKVYVQIVSISLPYADSTGSMMKTFGEHTLLLDESHGLPVAKDGKRTDSGLLCASPQYSLAKFAASDGAFTLVMIIYNEEQF